MKFQSSRKFNRGFRNDRKKHNYHSSDNYKGNIVEVKRSFNDVSRVIKDTNYNAFALTLATGDF